MFLVLILYGLFHVVKRTWRADRVVFLALALTWIFGGAVWWGHFLFNAVWTALALVLLVAGLMNVSLGVEVPMATATRRWWSRQRLAAADVAHPAGAAVSPTAAAATDSASALSPGLEGASPHPPTEPEAPTPPEATRPARPKPPSAGRLWLSDFLDTDALGTRETTSLDAVERLNATLRNTLRGQEVAIDVVVKGLRRIAARAVADPHRPLSFLFIGPTGVGKTQIVKLTAEALGRRLLRYDMGQYKDQSALWELWGSPQGFHGDEGFLTKAVKSTPDAVVLFDEIEKAHPEIYDSLLSVLDEGKVKDRRTSAAVSFSKTIIMFTSNLVPDIPDEVYAEPGRAKDLVLETGFLRKEFIGRIQFVVPFRALTPKMIHQIAVDQLTRFARSLEKDRRCEVGFDGRIPGFLVNKADLKFGARDLEQLITRCVADPFAEAVVARQGTAFKHAVFTVQDDTIKVELT